MGIEYNKRPIGSVGGLVLPVETITLSSAMQTLSNDGVSFVNYTTSGNPSDAVVPDPDFVGQVKKIVMNNGTTSLEANFNTGSTGNVFFGTTFNTITANSTANDSSAFELVGQSTSAWAILSLSVNGTTGATHMDWALSATTGSTGQA